MDGREGGFIKLHRRILSSPDLTGFRGEHFAVFVQLLFLANWKPGHFWVGKYRVDVDRGELAHSLQQIAKEANTSVRVVRTTIDNLLARGVLTVRNDTPTATRVRVLRVVNYRKYQDAPNDSDTTSDTKATQQRHDADTTPTPIEEGEEGEAGKRETLRLAPLDAPPSKPRAKTDPLRRTLSDALVAVYAVERGGAYGFDQAKDGQALTRLLGWSRDVSEHARRFGYALRAPGGDFSYRVDTIAAFATGRIWNHFAASSSGAVVTSLRKL